MNKEETEVLKRYCQNCIPDEQFDSVKNVNRYEKRKIPDCIAAIHNLSGQKVFNKILLSDIFGKEGGFK